MRIMQALVVIMGVLIVAGVAIVAVTIVNRIGPSNSPPTAPVVIDEPAGTHIASASMEGRHLLVVLQGGGPDRVAIIDLTNGRMTGGLALAH